MIRDEFNQIEVTNDKQLLHTEFGKTQKVEFSSQQENKTPEGDLNEKYVGKTIRKETEVNVDYINKVPSHGTQTVVTSTSTASTAAAATAGTAVAASTVAVVAIATVTGISVAMHDYKYEFKSLIISSNELRYELYVYDAMLKDDEYLHFDDQQSIEEEYDEMSSAPFKLRVYNKNYDASQYLWDRSTNMGVFENLTLGDTYNIVLTENRYGGEEIYKDTFVTYVNSTILDFTVYQYTDYVEGTFDINLDFIDDDNSIDEIFLEFYEPEYPEEVVAVFAIEKEPGFKTISALDDNGGAVLDLNKEYGYRVKYNQDAEEKIFKEDTVTFEDYAGRKSVFNEFIFDKTANFIENSITVRLDYVDRLGWYDDFKLSITMIPQDNQGTTSPDDYYTQEIPLLSTSEPQTIVLNEYEIYARNTNFKYTYSLSCLYQGERMILKEETTPFSFTDTSGGVSEFYGFVFPKEANFLNNTFKVRLDYQDDFSSFSSFVLHLFPEGVNAQYDFALDYTNEEQTLTFDESQHWNFSFDYTYTYTLTYWDDFGEVTIGEDSESFVFTDISGGISEFNGVIFDGKYDIGTGLAPVQLDYQDDYGYFSDFTMLFYGPIANQGGNNPFRSPTRAGGNDLPSIEDYEYEIELEKTTEVQYINLYEAGVPASSEDGFLYALKYNRRGEEQTPYQPIEQIHFVDPDANSEVFGIEFVNGEANFLERSFKVKLKFEDDYGYFSDFALQVRDTKNGGWVQKELAKTTEEQTVTIDEYDYENNIYPVDIVSGTLTYNFVYVTSETGDPAQQYFYEQEPSLSFENSLRSEFYDLETSFDFSSTDVGSEYRLPFRFDMVNDAEYYSVPEIYIAPANNQNEVLATIAFANEVVGTEWQYGSFSPNGDFTIEELTNGDEYLLVVAMQYTNPQTDEDYRSYVYTEPHTFTLDQKQEIHSVDVSNYITAGNWEVYTTIIANGNLSGFSNGEITFQRADGDYAALVYDVEISEYMTVDLHSPKEYTVNEDDLQEYFSHPVNITFKYSKPGSSEIITINCYSNFLFTISN